VRRGQGGGNNETLLDDAQIEGETLCPRMNIRMDPVGAHPEFLA
jgi:hypothetical protein